MRLILRGLEPKCKAFGFILPTPIPGFKFFMFVLPTPIPRFKFMHVCSTDFYSSFQYLKCLF